MGTAQLVNRSSGQIILQNFFNDIHAALETDFVGRDTNGNPVSGNNLGTVAYPWGNAYLNTLILSGSTLDISMIESQAYKILSGKVRSSSNQPAFLVAAGSSAQFTVKATSTNLALSIAGAAATWTVDATFSATVAPNSNNTALINDATAVSQIATRTWGEYGSGGANNATPYYPITIDTVGSNISALVGTYQVFKHGTEYFLAFIESATSLTRVMRGYFFDSTGAPLKRTTLADDDTLTLMNLGYVFLDSNGSTADTIFTGAGVNNSPHASKVAPSSPVSGDYWYDTANNQWKRYNGSSFVLVNRILVGLVVSDATNCVAARSFDFFSLNRTENTVDVGYLSTTSLSTRLPDQRVSVKGKRIQFIASRATWSTSNLAGSTERYNASVTAANPEYCYVTDQGDTVLTDMEPYYRPDLLGLYHPFNPWRCVGRADVNAGPVFSTSPLSVFEEKFVSWGPSVRAKDFGAYGNGVADDTVAIQNALAAITSGEVLIEGTCLISSELVVPDNKWLVGKGKNSSILRANANSINLIHHTGTYGGARNLGLDANGHTGVSGLRVTPLASYTFTVTAANATAGATYTNNGVTFRVLATIAGATTLTTTANDPPTASGTLTKASGTGDGTITFSAFTAPYLSTVVNQNYNRFDGLLISSCAEGAVLQCGPRVSGTDSGCWYNTFIDIQFYNCIRSIWFKDPPNTASANNRNKFYSIRMGNGGNTGIQVDSGTENEFFGLATEGILNGSYSITVSTASATAGATYTNNGITFTVLATIAGATTLLATGSNAPAASGTLTKTGGTGDATITFSAFTSVYPNATPTAVYIKQTSANSGDNNSQRLVCWETEACSRDLNLANAFTEFFGCSPRTNNLFTANPLIMIGGLDASNVPQVLPGYIYQGGSQISPWANNLMAIPNGQVQFPATQNPSILPQVLDDYQEGSWSPTVNAAGMSGQVYSFQSGYFQKVGRWVHFTAHVKLSSYSAAGTNYFGIDNLPYQVANTADANESYVFPVWISPLQGLSAGDFFVAIVGAGGVYTAIQRMNYTGDNSGTGLHGANTYGTVEVIMSGSYRATS